MALFNDVKTVEVKIKALDWLLSKIYCIVISRNTCNYSENQLLEGLLQINTMVLYMSFDRFLLADESCDLSQADKILIRVSPSPKLSDR